MGKPKQKQAKKHTRSALPTHKKVNAGKKESKTVKTPSPARKKPTAKITSSKAKKPKTSRVSPRQKQEPVTPTTISSVVEETKPMEAAPVVPATQTTTLAQRPKTITAVVAPPSSAAISKGGLQVTSWLFKTVYYATLIATVFPAVETPAIQTIRDQSAQIPSSATSARPTLPNAAATGLLARVQHALPQLPGVPMAFQSGRARWALFICAAAVPVAAGFWFTNQRHQQPAVQLIETEKPAELTSAPDISELMPETLASLEEAAEILEAAQQGTVMLKPIEITAVANGATTTPRMPTPAHIFFCTLAAAGLAIGIYFLVDAYRRREQKTSAPVKPESAHSDNHGEKTTRSEDHLADTDASPLHSDDERAYAEAKREKPRTAQQNFWFTNPFASLWGNKPDPTDTTSPENTAPSAR